MLSLDNWYNWPPNDFIKLGDAKTYFIHTDFMGGVGKNKRYHNYWVHNLIEFKGSKILSANKKNNIFPKWVWYSFAENHKDTDQLSSAQRQSIYSNYQSDSEYKSFPYLTLSKEQ